MAVNIAIQQLRGPVANMPLLPDGVFYLATDTGQLYVGLGGINFSLGVKLMSSVTIQGNANPTRFIEPNADGSISVVNNAAGKTAVLKTGTITSTAVTANQIILTYTVTAAKTLFLEFLDIVGRLTVPAATASVLGSIIVQVAGVTVYNGTIVNPTTSDCGSQRIPLVFGDPIPLAAGTVVSILVTPAAVTSMLWLANLVGYEK